MGCQQARKSQNTCLQEQIAEKSLKISPENKKKNMSIGLDTSAALSWTKINDMDTHKYSCHIPLSVPAWPRYGGCMASKGSCDLRLSTNVCTMSVLFEMAAMPTNFPVSKDYFWPCYKSPQKPRDRAASLAVGTQNKTHVEVFAWCQHMTALVNMLGKVCILKPDVQT